ncbi:vigilin-like [Biomphalaria glabrata]|uniref:Vigilin-like n=1 Tax=Biomphalaria glabrata TaxID=6526 RepID=A0A9W2YL18_BIOGL|nr:vigilin-like [Biomphalaria glabrata]
MASNTNGDGATSSKVDLQAFEPEFPTYDNAFPKLPPNDARSEQPIAPSIAPGGAWQPKFLTRQSKCTQVFTVPLEERKFKEMNERQFGEESEQMKICKEIMQKTGVSIELSLARDQSMTVVINGRQDAVMKARREVVNRLQTQASTVLNIPREYHRFILGKSGKKLQEIELATATKIFLPRADDKSNPNEIKIVGSKEGIDKARHEIEAIHEEQAKLAFERLPIPKVYHPFVCGPNKENVNRLMEETGAKISVSPHKDEIVVSGEKDGVLKCKQNMMAIYEEKKRKCQTVSVEVKKSQHKYVVGPRHAHIQEILATTGVSVEVPDLNSPSETITLRGEQEKLGQALTEVYSKANSVVFSDVVAPAWLHRFIIGRKGSNIKEITENFPSVHIEFTEGQDKITIEGPPDEVTKVVEKLNAFVKDLVKRMDFAEIQVDQKFHKHIIGKSGANISKIKQETGVSIRIPSDGDNSNIIRIEGDPQGVKIAKEQLLEMANRMENEKTRDIIIEHRFHRQIIGAKGESIREIRDKFNQVQITFPDQGKKSDVVTLRGPKNDVDKAFKHLQTLVKDLVENNYQAQVHIFKDFHKNIIGKGGNTIKKIREETDTKIDLPSEISESDVITITGKKANVEKAQAKIEAIQKEMGNIKEIIIDIPNKLHNSLIGTKGRFIRSIMEDCGGVMIRFPQEGTKSDKVVIRGPSADVENAKQQLLELANERKDSSYTVEVKAKPQYHKFLIGRGGATIRKVRENTGVRIIFPGQNDPDQETISIIGKEENVQKAKEELEKLIKSLDNIVEGEVHVDPKHHRNFVARRGEVLRQIAEDYGGVIVSFPRSGVNSDRVVIKGAKECVEAAKKKILEIVEDLESQVTVECVIAQADHRTVMGSGGANVREITRQYDVGIKFPDKPALPNGNSPDEPLVNGEAEENTNGPRKSDIIIITGKPDNCQSAKQALLDLVPVIEEVNVPYELHKFIIGQRGRDVRKLMQDFDVNISIPAAEEHSDVVKVRGPPVNVSKARAAILERVNQLEQEREDRELKSFKLTVEVDEKYHPKIIGRKGNIISVIRKNHDVNIQFPEKGSENPSLITITGYQQNAEAAREEILKIVKDYEDMYVEEVPIDARVHPRIIGTRGRGINKLMEDFEVEIRFPRPNDADPNLVTITGAEDNVLDCKDYLLNMEEEYLQDYVDKQRAPSKSASEPAPPREPTLGFVVKDAPWDRAPDTASQEEFPSFGAVVAPRGKSWGPMKK